MFLLLTAGIIIIAIVGRIYYRRHRKSQETIADYASVAIIRVELRPDLPQRRTNVHMESNGSDRCQLEEQPANEKSKDASRSSRFSCPTEVNVNEISSNAAEIGCDQSSMIGFDDDGYPVMQRTGGIYMDVLPPQTDPKVTTTVSESQVTKDQCSKQRCHQDTQCAESDGYSSLWP